MTLRTFDDPNSLEARQGLLDRRTERNHPKRHRTKKRSAKIKAAKKQKAAHRASIKAAAMRRYHEAARAFWTGQRDEHP